MGLKYSREGENAYKIELNKENLLGNGNFGSVYKITRKFDNLVCAGKFIRQNYDTLTKFEKDTLE